MQLGADIRKELEFYQLFFDKLTEKKDPKTDEQKYFTVALFYNNLIIVKSKKKDPEIDLEKLAKFLAIFYRTTPLNDQEIVDFTITTQIRKVHCLKFSQEENGTPYFIVTSMRPHQLYFRREILELAQQIRLGMGLLANK